MLRLLLQLPLPPLLEVSRLSQTTTPRVVSRLVMVPLETRPPLPPVMNLPVGNLAASLPMNLLASPLMMPTRVTNQASPPRLLPDPLACLLVTMMRVLAQQPQVVRRLPTLEALPQTSLLVVRLLEASLPESHHLLAPTILRCWSPTLPLLRQARTTLRTLKTLRRPALPESLHEPSSPSILKAPAAMMRRRPIAARMLLQVTTLLIRLRRQSLVR
jgi:hypothetical protein